MFRFGSAATAPRGEGLKDSPALGLPDLPRTLAREIEALSRDLALRFMNNGDLAGPLEAASEAAGAHDVAALLSRPGAPLESSFGAAAPASSHHSTKGK